MKQSIILASASPRRKELLEQVGIFPEIVPSTIEEVISSEDPYEVVKELSLQKAVDVARDYKQADRIVLGADTIVVNDSKILGKPKDKADAVVMLQGLQGKYHEVITGVTLIFCKTGRIVTFSDVTKVFVLPMTGKEIETYVESGEPMDKAGAYGIQGLFGAYVERIEGNYSNVVGLPIHLVWKELVTRR